MPYLTVLDFTGHLHPVVVHLPIGILFLAIIFELFSGIRHFRLIRPAIPVMVFFGMLAAVIACITGLALASGGEYEDELIGPHQWSGISLAIGSIALYILYKVHIKSILLKKILSGALLILITITGHLGGSITHGSDYLTASFSDKGSASAALKPIANIQEAMLYTDVVQPLFQSRCYNCHSAKKQKGGLRLDDTTFILKGGEGGNTLVAGKPEESELIERLLLPSGHDDRMPPKGKPQLTKEQVEVLQWWINTGADFHKKVNELEQTEQVKLALAALETGHSSVEKEIAEIPGDEVPVADPLFISRLSNAGVAVIPVGRETNYLTANFVSSTGNIDSLLSMLDGIKKQLISLKVDAVTIKDSSIKKIGELNALRKLQLTNVPITSEGLKHLAALKELRSLNLVGTGVTADGLLKLSGLKNLENLYLYRTGISPAEREELNKRFPSVNIDYGNYTLPMLATDTTEIKI